MRRIAAFIVMLVAALVQAPFVRASSISPQSITLGVEPGSAVTQAVRIENSDNEAQTFALDVWAVTFGQSADDLRFEPLATNDRSWIDLSADVVEIGAEGNVSVDVTVNPSADAQPRVFSFAIVAIEQLSEDQPGVSLATGLASIFFVNIGNTGDPTLRIDSFATVPEKVRKPPVRFAALVSNPGSSLAQPEIGVAIKNIWGKEVEILPLNPTQRRVPAQTYRVFSAEWQPKGLRFGPYTAELYVFPDDSPRTLTATTNVVLFPWQTLSVFAIVVVIFAGVLYKLARVRRSSL